MAAVPLRFFTMGFFINLSAPPAASATYIHGNAGGGLAFIRQLVKLIEEGAAGEVI
jgi:hypothetical protein